MSIHNKIKIYASTVFISFFLLNSEAKCFPGDTVKQWDSWDKKQTFFPTGDAQGRVGNLEDISDVLYFKPLSENRLLTYRFSTDYESRKLNSEEIYITNSLNKSGVNISDLCKITPVTQYPTLTNFSGDREDCIRDIGVDFTAINSPEIAKIFEVIYGERHSILLNDLKNAQEIKKGKIFYKDNFSSRSRQSLKHGPIDVLYLKGNKFLYLITNYGISMAPKSQDNPFERFFKEWSEDNKLRNRMIQKENQQKIEQERKKPFEL